MTEDEKPDFHDWIKSTSGKDCLQWPISDPKYLENRLFWAFDAGRDRIWDQYLKQKQLTEHAHSEGFNQGWNECLEAVIKQAMSLPFIFMYSEPEWQREKYKEELQKLRK